MALFQTVVTYQLPWLCYPMVLGNFQRACRRYNPASDGANDELERIFLGTIVAVAICLLQIRAELAFAFYAESRRPGANSLKGIGSIASRWRRAWLCGMLLVAVGLSASAAFLAVHLFQDGCAAYLGFARVPVAVLLFVSTALGQGFCAWVAVCQD